MRIGRALCLNLASLCLAAETSSVYLKHNSSNEAINKRPPVGQTRHTAAT